MFGFCGGMAVAGISNRHRGISWRGQEISHLSSRWCRCYRCVAFGSATHHTGNARTLPVHELRYPTHSITLAPTYGSCSVPHLPQRSTDTPRTHVLPWLPNYHRVYRCHTHCLAVATRRAAGLRRFLPHHPHTASALFVIPHYPLRRYLLCIYRPDYSTGRLYVWTSVTRLLPCLVCTGITPRSRFYHRIYGYGLLPPHTFAGPYWFRYLVTHTVYSLHTYCSSPYTLAPRSHTTTDVWILRCGSPFPYPAAAY